MILILLAILGIAFAVLVSATIRGAGRVVIAGWVLFGGLAILVIAAWAQNVPLRAQRIEAKRENNALIEAAWQPFVKRIWTSNRVTQDKQFRHWVERGHDWPMPEVVQREWVAQINGAFEVPIRGDTEGAYLKACSLLLRANYYLKAMEGGAGDQAFRVASRWDAWFQRAKDVEKQLVPKKDVLLVFVDQVVGDTSNAIPEVVRQCATLAKSRNFIH